MVEATLGTARFYSRSGPYSLAVVASVAPGVADELELLLEGVAPLQTARPNEVSFLDNRRCASALEQTSAGAVPSMVVMSRRSLLGHLQPSCAAPTDGSLSPDSFRARRMLLTAESGHVGHTHSRHGSNELSKVWPRRGLAVRTSPRGWRRPERLLERAGECRLGVIADNFGNLCEGRAGVAELLSRDLHAPTGEVVHRRHADQANEAVS